MMDQALLLEIGRIGVGLMFLVASMLDLRTRDRLYELMTQKGVPTPRFMLAGAVSWKLLASIALVLNIYAYWAALLLALYIFLATCIFMNFWSLSGAQRDEALIGFVTNQAVAFGLLAIAAGY